MKLQSTSRAPACPLLICLGCWLPLPPQMLPLMALVILPICHWPKKNPVFLSFLQRNPYACEDSDKPCSKALMPNKSEEKFMPKLPHKKGKYHARSLFSPPWVTEKNILSNPSRLELPCAALDKMDRRNLLAAAVTAQTQLWAQTLSPQHVTKDPTVPAV